MADITIRHTRADGTLIEGSRKDDGVFEIAYPHGFRYFRSIRRIGLPRSRDQQAKMSTHINPAAQALRAAGHSVTVEIDEDHRRSFTDAETDRVTAAERRADRFGRRADKAVAAGTTKIQEVEEWRKRIPPAQPFLGDHYSAGRDIRNRERMHRKEDRGFEDLRRARHWHKRADAAAHYEQFRNNPAVTLRRIQKLEADQRRVDKWLRGESAGGFQRNINDPEVVAELERQRAALAEELEYWRAVVAKAAADGFKVWGKDDFAKGDFARINSQWFQILRVNAKSVTVPAILNVRAPVVTTENNGYGSRTHTVPYDKVTGRISAEEMRQRLAEPPA